MRGLPTGTPLGQLRLLEVYHFYDGPKLFACLNTGGQRFLAFWLDDRDDGDEWLYVPVSEARLSLLRIGALPLRLACVEPEDGWVWRIWTPWGGSTPTWRMVVASDLSSEDLPTDGAVLTSGESPRRSVIALPSEDLGQRAIQSRHEILDYSLEPSGSRRNEVATSVLATSLLSAQLLIDSIVLSHEGYKSRRGRIPANLRQESQLFAVATFPSSFGLRLESHEIGDLFGESKLGRALREFFALLQVGSDFERLKAELSELGGRVAAHYTVFLTALANSKTDLKLAWGSPRNDTRVERIEISWNLALQVADILQSRIDEIAERFVISARLEGVDVDKKSFNLVNLETGDRYSGRVEDDFVTSAERAAARVPAEYKATLLQVHEIAPATGEVRERYRLLQLDELPSK